MTALPELALSVRQPWAWAIIHAGKDIENRDWIESRLLRRRGRIAVHAAKRLTRAEYDDASGFMKHIIGIQCPAATDLLRGGIIGSVEVVDDVSASYSPWFLGPRGLVLKDPAPHSFIAAVGSLGYFRWVAAQSQLTVATARWMQPPTDDRRAPEDAPIDYTPRLL